jgi:hypothetical protein
MPETAHFQKWSFWWLTWAGFLRQADPGQLPRGSEEDRQGADPQLVPGGPSGGPPAAEGRPETRRPWL